MDPYKVLGVSRDCSDEELKQAFMRSAKRWVRAGSERIRSSPYATRGTSMAASYECLSRS
eukprot:COSAG01_NODE_39016_length_482_cov_0.665796_2_plen_59_part_01